MPAGGLKEAAHAAICSSEVAAESGSASRTSMLREKATGPAHAESESARAM